MSELEYEVKFAYGSVSVIALAFVDEGDFVDDETLAEVVIRRACNEIANEFGDKAWEYEEVEMKHTGTIGGN